MTATSTTTTGAARKPRKPSVESYGGESPALKAELIATVERHDGETDSAVRQAVKRTIARLLKDRFAGSSAVVTIGGRRRRLTLDEDGWLRMSELPRLSEAKGRRGRDKRTTVNVDVMRREPSTFDLGEIDAGSPWDFG